MKTKYLTKKIKKVSVFIASFLVLLLFASTVADAQTTLSLSIDCHGKAVVRDQNTNVVVTTIQGPVDNSLITLVAGQAIVVQTEPGDIIPFQVQGYEVVKWEITTNYFPPNAPDPTVINVPPGNTYQNFIMGANETRRDVKIYFEIKDPKIVIDPVDNISTVTKTPVIIPITVKYDPANQVDYSTVYSDDILVDARIETTLSGGFPDGAEIIKVSLDGGVTNLISAPYDIAGETVLFLSDILGMQTPAKLVDEDGKVLNWEVTVAGIEDVVVIPVKVTSVGFTEYDVCFTDFDSQEFIVTFADAIVKDIEDFTTCWNVDYGFEYEITYPEIENLDTRIVNDAHVEVDKPLNSGTEIKIYYNSLLVQTYTLSAAYDEFFLSAMLNGNADPTTPENSLQSSLLGHSNLNDVWKFEIANLEAGTYTVTVENVAFLENVMYPYAGETFEIEIFPEPAVGFSFNGELAGTNSVFKYCYDEEVEVTLSSIWSGEAPFTISWAVFDGIDTTTDTKTNVNQDGVLFKDLLPAGTYTITITEIVDANGCEPSSYDPYVATVVIHPEPSMDFQIDGESILGKTLEFCYSEDIEINYFGVTGVERWDFELQIDKLGGGSVTIPGYCYDAGDTQIFAADEAPLGVGTYTITIIEIKDGNGCYASEESLENYWVKLIVHPEPSMDFQIDGESILGKTLEFCYSEDIEINYFGVTGVERWDFELQIDKLGGGSVTIPGYCYDAGDTQIFAADEAPLGVGTYTITIIEIKDGNGCYASEESLENYWVKLIVHPEPSMDFQIDGESILGETLEFCSSEDIEINYFGDTGVERWDFELQIDKFGGGSVTIPGYCYDAGDTQSFAAGDYPLGVGTYTVTITEIKDGNGCYASAESLKDYWVKLIIFAIPEIDPVAADDEVCGLEAELIGNVTNTYGAPVITWEKIDGPGTATFTASDAANTGVTVSMYGIYDFRLSVENGPCGTVSDVVTVTFYGTPEIYCPDNIAFCETEDTVIITSLGEYELPDEFGTATESYTSTTGDVEFDGNEITFTGGVGQHVITYWVENGPCVSSCTFIVFVYPEFEGEIEGEEIVFSGTKTVTYSIDPQDITDSLFEDGYWTTVGDVDVDIPKITFNNVDGSGAEAEIEIGCPGYACFDWEIIGDGEIILNYEIGDDEYEIYSGTVVGTKTGTLCELYIDDDFAFVGYTISGTFTVNINNFSFITESYVQWNLAVEDGDTAVKIIGPEDDYAIDIEVEWPFVGTYTLTVEVVSCAGCIWSDTKTVCVKANQLVGQLKYYNEAEGPMPSPFDMTMPLSFPLKSNTDLSVQGHFIVALLDISEFEDIEDLVNNMEDTNSDLDDLISYGEIDLVEFKPVMEYYKDEDEGKLHYHPVLTKDEYYEAAFGFEANLNPERKYIVIVFESFFDEEYFYFDYYVENLFTWTWNNWPGAWVGGVNATDALLIQHMTAHSLNGSGPQLPFRSAHPYNPFDVEIADANNNGNITSLDALLAQRRGMGLIPKFLNGALNFTVGGIFVDEADFNTNNIFGKGKFPELYKNLNDYLGNAYYVEYGNSYYEYPYISSLLKEMSGEKYLNIYYNAVGDVNSSFYPVYGGFKDAGITLSTEGELAANIGDVVDIPVSMYDFAELGAITLGLNFDNNLIEVLGTNYDEESAYFSNEDGQIIVMWADRNGVTFDKEQPLLTIKARILGNITPDTELLSLNEYSELANVQADIVYNNLKTLGLNTMARASALTATNYPNPLTNQTTISYNLPEAGVVKIVLYDKMGQEIATLFNAYENSGVQTYDFNQELAPGVYHYRITLFGENGDYTVTRSMIVVR